MIDTSIKISDHREIDMDLWITNELNSIDEENMDCFLIGVKKANEMIRKAWEEKTKLHAIKFEQDDSRADLFCHEYLEHYFISMGFLHHQNGNIFFGIME